jgi:hypothetical protein
VLKNAIKFINLNFSLLALPPFYKKYEIYTIS